MPDRLCIPYYIGAPVSDFAPESVHRTVQVPPVETTLENRLSLLYEQVANLVELPQIVYGTDCMSPFGMVAALQRMAQPFSLIWFDAHGDFNTWQTTHSNYIGGMSLAMLTGRGDQSIMEQLRIRQIDDNSVTLVGARDLDAGEDQLVACSAVRLISVAEVSNALPVGPLYVHFDVDVLDPGDIPVLSYPAPNGPALADIEKAIRVLSDSKCVLAMTVACTWDLTSDANTRAMQITERLLRPLCDSMS